MGGGIQCRGFAQRVPPQPEREIVEAVVGSTLEGVAQVRLKLEPAAHREVEADNMPGAAVRICQKLKPGGKLLAPAPIPRWSVDAGFERVGVDSTLVQGLQRLVSADVEVRSSEFLPTRHMFAAEVAVQKLGLLLRKNAAAAEVVGHNGNLEPLQRNYAVPAASVVFDHRHSDIADSRAHQHQSGSHSAADLLVEEADFHAADSL